MFIDEFKQTIQTLCGNLQGKTLFISSDVSLMILDALRRKEKLDLNDLIEVFRELITPAGNLIFPTYNWDFCKGIGFDYKKTLSRTGSLTQCALERKDFKRTKHPIYSFAVWGKDQAYLTGLDYTDSFGKDSLFAWFEQVGALNLFINVSYQNSATFVHFVEERNQVPYRFIKSFTADYTDENGKTSPKTYTMFVRYLDREVITTIDPMDEIFVKEQAVKKARFISSELKLLDMKKACALTDDNIIHHNADRIVIVRELANK